MTDYQQSPVSHGNPAEQALIRRWWHEVEQARGRLVWEYYLEGRYVDAVWFPCDSGARAESDGKDAPCRFPLKGAEVVLCEAKRTLTPELIGQALVYSVLAVRAQARLRGAIVFAEKGDDSMRQAAKALGLSVVVGTSSLEPPINSMQLAAVLVAADAERHAEGNAP